MAHYTNFSPLGLTWCTMLAVFLNHFGLASPPGLRIWLSEKSRSQLVGRFPGLIYDIWLRRHQVPAAVHLPASSSSTRIFQFRLSSPVQSDPSSMYCWTGSCWFHNCCALTDCPIYCYMFGPLQVLPWNCVWTMSRWTRSTIHCCITVWHYCFVMPNWVFTGLDSPRDPPGHDIGRCHCSGRGELWPNRLPLPPKYIP